MENLSNTLENINNLINNSEFRSMVIETAVKGVIPMDVWNNDLKLQTAIYYKVASTIVL